MLNQFHKNGGSCEKEQTRSLIIAISQYFEEKRSNKRQLIDKSPKNEKGRNILKRLENKFYTRSLNFF